MVSGCGGSHPTAQAVVGSPTAPTAGTGPAERGAPLVVVIEENHSFGQVIGSPNASRINELARSGVSLTNMYATTHPSLPNYIALTSGDTHGITSDCGKCDIAVPNLIDQLEQAKVSWHVYAQGFPGACSRTHRAGAYAKKHVPFLYYRSVFERPAVCAKVVSFRRFASDAKAGSLPAVSFVIPDLDHDMHGVGEGKNPVEVLRRADRTLGEIVGQLRASRSWTAGSRLVVTWDEGGGHEARRSCCGGRSKGGHIPTIVNGPGLRPGLDRADHDGYALLRSIEARLRLPFLGHATDAVAKAIPSITG